jgi:ABC-2 type transport system ATP-binding protein
VYGSLTVAEHLRLGERLNLQWDRDLTADRVGRLGLDLGQRAGRLSGGQRSQLALTLAMGKRPSCSCSTSRSPVSTRWPGGSSCRI